VLKLHSKYSEYGNIFLVRWGNNIIYTMDMLILVSLNILKW